MANTNPTPNEILTALRDYGVDLKTYSSGGKSWDTIGRPWNYDGGGLYGAVVHHTASAATGYSGAPSLSWVMNYASRPACNLLVGRGKGDTYLTSAGSCYHSGDGGPWPAIGINSAGNTAHFRTWGIEIEATVAYTTKSGNYIPESVPYITEYQVEQTAKTCAALLDLCGWDASGSTIVTHADWTDSGPYLGHSSYGPYRYRKNDTRRSTHSGQFWRKKALEYVSGGTSNPDPQESGSDKNEDKNPNNVVNLAKKVTKNAIATSIVSGTPQSARFALMNMSGQSIYISEGNSDVITAGSEGILFISARTIIEGEPYDVSRSIPDKSSSGELIVESPWIQNEQSANASLSLISSSFETKYKSIEIQLFGNPLIQLGDLVKFNYEINKVASSEDEYYIVSRISHNFDGGLSTTITINPVIKSFEMI